MYYAKNVYYYKTIIYFFLYFSCRILKKNGKTNGYICKSDLKNTTPVTMKIVNKNISQESAARRDRRDRNRRNKEEHRRIMRRMHHIRCKNGSGRVSTNAGTSTTYQVLRRASARTGLGRIGVTARPMANPPAQYQHQADDPHKHRNQKSIMVGIHSYVNPVIVLDTPAFDSANTAFNRMVAIAHAAGVYPSMRDLASLIHVVEIDPLSYQMMMTHNPRGFTIHLGDVATVSIALATQLTDPIQVLYLDLMGNSLSAAEAERTIRNLAHLIADGTSIATTFAARGDLPCRDLVKRFTVQLRRMATLAPVQPVEVYGYRRVDGNSQTMIFLKFVCSTVAQTLMIRPNTVTFRRTARYQFGNSRRMIRNDVIPADRTDDDTFDQVTFYGYGTKYVVWYPSGTVTPSANGVVGTLVKW